MDQDESFNIDFDRYFFALRKWHRLIIFSTLVVGVLALGFSFLSSSAYESEAVVAIVKSGVQLNFDPKFTTISEANSTVYVDPTARRKSLVTIAASVDIANSVLGKIGDQLPPAENPTLLLMNSVKAINDGDLIRIKATAVTSQTAALVANTWADEFTNRANAVYGENSISPEDIRAQATTAKKDYDTKEAAIVTYLASNPTDKLTRQISETRQILGALQSGKDTAVRTVVDKEIEARAQIIAAYLTAQANNRLVAFNKEQEEKNKLLAAFLDQEINNRVTAVNTDYGAKLATFKAYADNIIKTRVIAFEEEQQAKAQLFDAYTAADTSSQTAVISKQVEAKLAQLSGYYEEQAKLKNLSTEAKSLRARVQSGGSSSRSSATANSLALILLQASAFTTGASLPVSLQIPMDQLADLNATPDQQLRDLNLLIEILDSKQRENDLQIAQLSKALQNSDGYQFLPITTTASSQLNQAIKQNYDAMLRVGDLAKHSDTAVFDSELSDALLQKYNEMFGVGDLARVAMSTPFTSTLSTVIKQKYPELFQTGDLAKLSNDVSTDNPLALSAEEKAKALMQLDGLDKILQYSSTNEPITKVVDQLHQQVNELQAQLESESAKKQELVRARDLAWSTYSTLSNKAAEMNVAAQAAGTVVRIATPAVAPKNPTGTGKSIKTLIGLMVGFLLGVGIAFGYEFLHTTIRNENQVNKLLGLAVLGTIPEIAWKSKKDGAGNGNLMVLDSRSPATEAYRVLRHNFLSLDPMCRVVVVTSTVPAEGKSTVAANLATLIAQAGKRVVLVDADFRRPSQHKLFGAKNNQGLFDILSGAVENWQTYAQTTPIQNLRLVTSGALPRDPAILLGSSELRRWLDLLRQSVDYVVVDTPPSTGLADALIAARSADATLLVVGSDIVSEKDAIRAKEILAALPASLLGAVLNRTAEMPSTLTYAYYYAHRKEAAAAPDGTVSATPQTKSTFANLRDRFVNYIIPLKRS
ncbi:MAG: polysaccharide biosynthesis tyrosine autokinase [Chloroflexi bacterium]|nr:polysaccharide biosynthesis tyrosine autokinase [Chloroflexota bacterium]